MLRRKIWRLYKAEGIGIRTPCVLPAKKHQFLFFLMFKHTGGETGKVRYPSLVRSHKSPLVKFKFDSGREDTRLDEHTGDPKRGLFGQAPKGVEDSPASAFPAAKRALRGASSSETLGQLNAIVKLYENIFRIITDTTLLVSGWGCLGIGFPKPRSR